MRLRVRTKPEEIVAQISAIRDEIASLEIKTDDAKQRIVELLKQQSRENLMLSYEASFETAYEEGKKAAQEYGGSAINPYSDNLLGQEVYDAVSDGFVCYYHQFDISRALIDQDAVASHVRHMSWQDGHDEEMSAIRYDIILSVKSAEFRRGWMLEATEGDVASLEFGFGAALSNWRTEAEEEAHRSDDFIEGVLYGVCGDNLCDNPFQDKLESTTISEDKLEEAVSRYKEFAEGYKWYKVAEIASEVSYTLYVASCYVQENFSLVECNG